jgi:hypothetical protein
MGQEFQTYGGGASPPVDAKAKKRAYDAAYCATHKAERAVYYAAHYAAHRGERRAYSATYRAAHRAELRAYDAAHRNEKKAYDTAYGAAYRAAHRNEKKAYDTAYRYGITLNQRIAILKGQGGVCAICGVTEPGKTGWHTDHRHGTKTVRGILCQPCNHLLGNAKDNPATLRAATAYLERTKPSFSEEVNSVVRWASSASSEPI